MTTMTSVGDLPVILMNFFFPMTMTMMVVVVT
jgi:hypothetical protein